ncbi:DUF6779 domain-containing protein [Amycolatopsis sp.]|uniref:DUF6779 domain-containing protein n=1 Tax=Amycolatopsis sp. TaxID=37632 RepID=UPI002E069960|nr:DUF6779 domain-containing protein [Amycolatopsis sp.]
MTGVGDDSRGRQLGRPWLVVGITLAVGATLALVLSTDLRFLRLGIIAALWAALIGAFLAVKYRKHAAHSEDEVAEAQAVYELELEREVAARREFELEIEADARKVADTDSRTELDALRAEVVALRESLQSLFGGEVLYEHVALTAQATRMRSIKDDRLVTSSSESNGKSTPAQLLPGKKTVDIAERPTELIERVIEPVKAAPERRRTPAPTPSARPKQEEPLRRASAGDGASVAAARAAKAAAELRAEATRRQQQPVEKPLQQRPPQSQRSQPLKPQPIAQAKAAPPKPVQQPSEASRPTMAPIERRQRQQDLPDYTRASMEQTRVAAPASKPSSAERTSGERQPVAKKDGDWRKPAWKESASERSATNLAAAFPRSRSGIQPVPKPAAKPAPKEPEEPVRRGGSHRIPTEKKPAAVRETPAEQSSGGGRRRREDSASFALPPKAAPAPAPAPAPEPVSGGRRRRPDGEPPVWKGGGEAEPVNGSRHSTNGSSATNGSHSKPAAETGPPSRRGSRFADPDPAEAGSHAAGRSVNELLAAHGAADSTPRRRRRAED